MKTDEQIYNDYCDKRNFDGMLRVQWKREIEKSCDFFCYKYTVKVGEVFNKFANEIIKAGKEFDVSERKRKAGFTKDGTRASESNKE